MKQPITAYGDNNLKSTLFIEKVEGSDVFGKREVRDSVTNKLRQELTGKIAKLESGKYKWSAKIVKSMTSALEFDYSNFEAIVFDA